MINLDPRFVFVHIPKTAGVSMYEVFNTPRNQQHHKRLWEHYGWDHSYFKFAFVRNPWDRFLSCYHYFRKGGRGGVFDLHNAQVINQFPDFRSFLNGFDTIQHRLQDRHFFEQVFWLDDRLDFIGRYENLDADFDIVCDRMGMDHVTLPKLNASQRAHYTEAYDDQTAALIASHYAADIDRLGYRYGD